MANPQSGSHAKPAAEQHAPGGPETATPRHSLTEIATELARSAAADRGRPARLSLMERLPQQSERLEAAHQVYAHTTDEELAFSQAAEWLLDNYYVIRAALRQVKEDLPPSYYRELPKLNSGSLYHGYPRVYAVAREIVLYEGCRLDLARVAQFVEAYQDIQPLDVGEIWALPIMLRLSLLEALAQTVGRIAGTSLGAAGEPDPALRFAFDGGDGDVIANCIVSLRLLAQSDWQAFFEEVSRVERALHQDPAQLYDRLEFKSRDQYRKVVEEMARAAGAAEADVATAAVALAAAAAEAQPSPDGAEGPWAGLRLPREAHVGFYLIAAGLPQLERHLGYRPRGLKALGRWALDQATALYLASNSLLTLAIVAALLAYAGAAGGRAWQLILVALLGLIPASAVAVGLVNWLVTTLVPPRILPKLEFEDGIPAGCEALVVVPALLTSVAEVASLLRQLELHYLRNPDPRLGFALLSDFADAPEAEQPEDSALLAEARGGIEALNERYDHRPFFLLHRRRLFNPQEGVWMGWERKRGKLQELNRLLRGATGTSFQTVIGAAEFLRRVRYVITLDADTVLPADAARRLVGTLAHPLNRAAFDGDSDLVAAGYTILQPRTEIQPRSGGQSLFTRVFAGDTGLDLYSLAVSDVYQDLFGDGVYVGKGIYDVDAFQRSPAGRIPENSLLSHDLLEGLKAGAALVTDIVLYEDYPSHYLVHVRRSHRWIRGDWQLLPWLWRSLTGRERWRHAALDIWKIVDNLRRSLGAPALLAYLAAGWLFLPGSAGVWTLTGVLMPATALFTSAIMALVRGIGAGHAGELRRTIRDGLVRWSLQLVFLPYEALLAADAIGTTLWRLLVSRRLLLQWTTAAHTARLIGPELSADRIALHMIPSVLFTLGIGALIALFNPAALPVAAPFIVLWLLASEIAHRISQPAVKATPPLSAAERQRLHRLARRTWLFFESFVGPEDSWLPPDHYQEWPEPRVAHRTSPTNVGLYLLTALGAYDLGYVSALSLLLRLQSTFETFAQLERYRGHFLNWIDTRSLEPLPPRYVSTVDSGNLAASLLVLKQACLAMSEEPIWRPQRWQGLLDTLDMLEDAVLALGGKAPAEPMRQQLAAMRDLVAAVSEDPVARPELVERLADREQPELERRLLRVVEAAVDSLDPAAVRFTHICLDRLRLQLHGIQRQQELVLPWLAALQQPPALLARKQALPGVARLWTELREALEATPTLAETEAFYDRAAESLQALETALAALDGQPAAAAVAWCRKLADDLTAGRRTARSMLDSAASLAEQAGAYVADMDFAFLYDPQRQVFHIGYNVDRARLDSNYYDLLASEARIASIIAIAKRDVPPAHWLHLARPLTRLDQGLALLSWSGTMFEYLMPPLFMSSYPGTLLAETARVVADHQIAYGRRLGVPWGASESGFYAFDNALNYQYRAFGVPQLGYQRGLAEELVITPYASFLALALRPHDVTANLDHLLEYEMLGPYGLYEALDFTALRLELGRPAAVVRSYMAHHQGMIFLAILQQLAGDVMVRRMHAEPAIQSVELLLQEQVPPAAPLETPEEQEPSGELQPQKPSIAAQPWPVPLETPVPLVHYLSNGTFGSLVTSSGGGYLGAPDLAYTRWRPDPTQDNWGVWLYVQDRASGALWSAGLQPTGTVPQAHEVTFYPHRARYYRYDDEIALEMTVGVAPDHGAEIRRVIVTNDSDRTRRLRLTSYGEVVLGDQADDSRHQAFSKLFVESEYIREANLLLFTRRPRSAAEPPRYLGHMLTLASSARPLTRAYESDRARFLGRYGSPARPQALASSAWLSGTTGATLDPIMALGQDVVLAPHDAVELALVTLTADSRAELLQLADDYRRWSTVQRALGQARAQAEQELRLLDLPIESLQQTQTILSLLLYPHHSLRAEAAVLTANRRGQSGLWTYSISGDFPILLARITDEQEVELLHFVLRAHRYWRRRGLKIDLVILSGRETTYDQPVQGFIYRTIQRLESENWLNRRGGIFVLRWDQLTEEDRVLLQTVARVTLDGSAGPVADQLGPLFRQVPVLPDFWPAVSPGSFVEEAPPVARPGDLRFDNGTGGFSADGREYVIYLEPGQSTPAPWINVVANPAFGFLISESGGGYTWAANSGENRLTTWRNDPVRDAPAEALYLRDEETAEVWSPTPQPAPAGAPYLVRHGAGYTVFEHHSHGLRQRLRLFVAPDAPVKIAQLRLENASGRPRRLTGTYYAEWVLGTRREQAQPHLNVTYHPQHNGMLVRNFYNPEFSGAAAFLAADRPLHGLTADRLEFLGRRGDLSRPAALRRIGLDNRLHPGQDSCGVVQLHVDLAPGESQDLTFLIGEGSDEAEALGVIERFQDPAEVAAAWEATARLWDEILGAVAVQTPDPAMDLLLNRWLLYQALACRYWARSALYQSSGGYGFRDQLQDVMALVHARPDLAREHLGRAASHQFTAGDVLHWWQPPSGSGVRTRISDDLVWLPYVLTHYVTTTGDDAILDEEAPFLVGRHLADEELEHYDLFGSSAGGHSLYEHACRALEHAATLGPHNLPLMGTGDWNDGMNRVGAAGKGESIWLAWFLAGTLNDFAALCEARGDGARAAAYRQQAAGYRQAVETSGWDGHWYLRAFYDDGFPLGSSRNKECRIDAIAQSWAVLTGLGDPGRAAAALDAARQQLVRESDRLILLLAPPFDQTTHDPGYIKGYPPGIRENGGQYTHAALWTIWAHAALGEGDRAAALYRLINPIYRSDTAAKASHYQVEPYVISADVYGVPPHVGRGGWTWYTGSAAWMYRLGVERILGIQRRGDILHLDPCIPRDWPEYQLSYRFGAGRYAITVRNPAGVNRGVGQISLDGRTLEGSAIPLDAAEGHHQVEVVLGLLVPTP